MPPTCTSYHMPNLTTGLPPIDLFTKTRCWPQHKLHDLHVWGRPVYVLLDKTLADGKTLPRRWKPCSVRCCVNIRDSLLSIEAAQSHLSSTSNQVTSRHSFTLCLMVGSPPLPPQSISYWIIIRHYRLNSLATPSTINSHLTKMTTPATS